jgi:putative transposase
MEDTRGAFLYRSPSHQWGLPPRLYATYSEKIAANSNETGDPPVRTSRYSDEQIAAALRQAEAGTPVAEVIRKLGISAATFYAWKRRFGSLGTPEIRESGETRASQDRSAADP